MEIGSRLTNYFCKKYNIDPNAVLKVEKVRARELIVPNRIDLIAKIKYIEFREKGFDMLFARELYQKHIEAFSLGTFIEPGDNDKNSIKRYFETFDRMIDSIKENGFNDTISLVPVGDKNTILDGAHRTAIAAYFDLELPVIRINGAYVDYGTEFFKKRLLEEKYLDYMVSEYCKLKENVYFACIWPKAKGEDKIQQAEKLIKESTTMVYFKKSTFNYQGIRNLMTQIYSSQEWIGNIENNFLGTQKKADACFDEGETEFYILESNHFNDIIELKRRIRKIFNIGNHSVHITDNSLETIQMCNLLLNENSLHFLRNGEPYYYKNFYKKLNKFKRGILDNNLSLEEFIIDSSSILGLYGLREANDIDFLSISSEYNKVEEGKIQNHHDYINFYNTSIDNLILNPSNYFVYDDLKFTTLDIVKEFKKNRNEKKDQLDVQLINGVLNKKKMEIFTIKIITFMKKKTRTLKQYAKIYSRRFLKKVYLYEKVKETYSFLKENKG